MLCMVLTSSLLPTSAAREPGLIRGTVVDEKGMPVAAAQVRVDPANGLPRSNIVREVETNEGGQFLMDNLAPGSYKVFARKETAGYPNTAFAFYSNHVFPTATLTASAPAIDLILRIGPPAAVIHGSVRNASTKVPVDASFLLRRAADLENWISMSQRPDYRVLIPPLTEITFEVSAPGYKTYYYAGATDPLKRPALRLESRQELKLDIELEPEDKP